MTGAIPQLRSVAAGNKKGLTRYPRKPCALHECRREDSNLHTLNGYQVLNLARLPIPPLRRPHLRSGSACYYSRLGGFVKPQRFAQKPAPPALCQRIAPRSRAGPCGVANVGVTGRLQGNSCARNSERRTPDRSLRQLSPALG